MNVLLVYPQMPPTFWKMKFIAKIRMKKSVYPPLGLLTVAALLPLDWSVKLIDLNVRQLTEKDLCNIDYVFISAMNVQAFHVRDLIKQLKRTNVKIVAGGPLFTHEYESFEGIDHFILNEAELTLPLFLQDLAQGNAKRIYQTNEFADISSSPIPRWELINKNDYLYGIVQYSRGCPHQCDFCDVTSLFGRKQRIKNPTQILNEIQALGDLSGFDMLLFADDNLIGNKKILKESLLPALIDWRAEKKPPVSFGTQVSINLVDDDELMQLMSEAGFRNIFVGIETASVESLEQCGKSQNLQRNTIQSINRLHAKGFIISGGFILGFDSDTSNSFQQQIDLIQQSGIVISTVNLLKAPLGTKLHKRMYEENRLLEELDFSEFKINLIPKMDIEELYQGYSKVLKEISDPQRIFERVEVFMNTFKKPKVKTSIRGVLKISDFITLFLMVLWIGILSPERFYFWKLIYWIKRKHPEHMSLGLFFGIFMHFYHLQYLDFVKYKKSKEYEEFIKTTKDLQ